MGARATEPLRVGWFSSGRGPGSQALLARACAAIEGGELPLRIAYVFCNRERGEWEPADRFLDLAEAHALPTITLSSSRFRQRVGGEIARAGSPLPAWRSDYDRAILRLIAPYAAPLAVLAGYQLIAPELCRQLPLLNLHPAVPGGPIGLWQEVIWQLIATQACEGGITIFRATADLDAGPPLSYCRYSIRDAAIAPLWQAIAGRRLEELRRQEGEELPLFREIRRRGATREAPLLLTTLASLARGALSVEPSAPPLDLSDEVDRVAEAGL